MTYNLNDKSNRTESRGSTWASVKSLISHMVEEKRLLVKAALAMMISAILTLLGPVVIGYTIDHYIAVGKFKGVLIFGALLLFMYIISMFGGYFQSRLMGTVGQNMLFTLRNAVFAKVQELPLDFFNQNKTGDLISRINNDTDKINQFFSQSLMQFLRSILIMTGVAIFMVSIKPELGLIALLPAVLIFIFTRILSPWIRSRNAVSLRSMGMLSSEIQESLNNFKVIVAFNRRDYFSDRFNKVNRENYQAAFRAGISNNLLTPAYGFFSNMAIMLVLTMGIFLIIRGHFTVGLLISFMAYVNSFYHPLQQMAALWSSFQLALAAWDRILVILNLENNQPVVEAKKTFEQTGRLTFRCVSFSYPGGGEVLRHISFDLYPGKTYAFVGPTGGGKTTTASLLSRLYDAGKGMVLLDGRDIRSYSPDERALKIGFILQDPFLFSGTIRENLIYGNEQLENCSNQELSVLLNKSGLEKLMLRFDRGLETRVDAAGDGISLGQKQLIAFMRAVLRQPDLLILDEATANIDTVTEQLLDEIIRRLPVHTTKVIIAHRLNTIANADEIFFVNNGRIIRAGSFNEAIEMLMHGKVAS